MEVHLRLLPVLQEAYRPATDTALREVGPWQSKTEEKAIQAFSFVFYVERRKLIDLALVSLSIKG